MERNLPYQTKRISLMIKEEQYRAINSRGLNISALVRDLIDDYFNSHKVTLSLSPEGRELYDQIISHTGATDTDIEPFFVDSLKTMLQRRIDEMTKLQQALGKKGHGK